MVKGKLTKNLFDVFSELRPHEQSLNLHWQEHIALKIMELEPLMMFFRKNLENPTEADIQFKIKILQNSAQERVKFGNKYENKQLFITYQSEFGSHKDSFHLKYAETIPMCSLGFYPNGNLSKEFFLYHDGLAQTIKEIFADQDPDIMRPLEINGIKYWRSESWNEEIYTKIKEELSEEEIEEFDTSANIEELEFDEINYGLYGDWEYTDLDFFFDKELNFYVNFIYYDAEDDATMTVLLPISAEKIAEFYFYCESVESDFNVYIYQP